MKIARQILVVIVDVIVNYIFHPNRRQFVIKYFVIRLKSSVAKLDGMQVFMSYRHLSPRNPTGKLAVIEIVIDPEIASEIIPRRPRHFLLGKCFAVNAIS
ncbi:hypothetical protein IH824_12440 [candidate division KSB1 bacterium]|nr:hypothetical protein [candidate division KSB1 bacterium]